jgi:hypothetical protein
MKGAYGWTAWIPSQTDPLQELLPQIHLVSPVGVASALRQREMPHCQLISRGWFPFPLDRISLPSLTRMPLDFQVTLKKSLRRTPHTPRLSSIMTKF